MKFAICCVLLFLSAVLASATIDSTLQMQLGNPSGAIVDTNNHDHYLIQRPVEALDYSDNLGEPVWASWDLTAGDVGSVPRSPNFFTDTNLPPNFYRVTDSDYDGDSTVGINRGHLCPSEDRTDTTNDNNMVFLMSNIMAQNDTNNSGVWGTFEGYCRSQLSSNEMLIICGPSGFGTNRIPSGKAVIADYVWKIAVFVPTNSGTALSRITATNRVVALKIPNNATATNAWQHYVTSAAQIEVDTGFTFFTALPPTIAAALRAKVDGQTNPPPVILTFSPTSGAAGTNVVITGTNFSAATAVTFNGAPAVYTVNSSNQITATVPANAGSGFISVTTPSGTAVSTNSFTVFSSGGGMVYSGVLAGWDVSGIPTGMAGNAANFGVSPLPPTTNGLNLGVVGLTRGSGVGQSGSGAARGWGGTGFTSVTAANAISANQFVSFSLAVSNGYKVSYTTINRLDFRRSASGPTNGVLQFQVGNGAFTDITTLVYTNTSNGSTNVPVDLTVYPTLQNVGANTNVTFRIANYNGASGGTWYVWDNASSTALDLSVQGTVTQVLTVTSNPGFQSFSFAGGNPSLTITGAVAMSYTILASTNLSATNWTTLLTTNPGSLPFTFVDTNGLPLRFYRVQNP
ncbi:MAG TPA: DNA/RNA non-specific endonuclease [Candidatus Acidoferrales bacterium]|nr:DNA/RNA non-specific endonuclease [Candidatus Acidoferrales bacterium]